MIALVRLQSENSCACEQLSLAVIELLEIQLEL